MGGPELSGLCLLIGSTLLVAMQSANAAEAPGVNPGATNKLVREVVYNELHDHDSHGYWRYWIQRRSSGKTSLQEQIETSDGPVEWVEQTDGHVLSESAQEEQTRRLQHLLSSPSEQADHRKAYAEDERRIGRILGLLPDAFLYEDEPEQSLSGRLCYHMRFRPNPEYPVHSIEARIFHAMTGEIWISVQNKHLVRLEGQMQENVDFGYGILGRLYKGGWFRLDRTKVSSGATSGVGNEDWKTERLEIHMIGRAMLFKTIARETSEVRTGFSPVPPRLSLRQAAEMIEASGSPAKEFNSVPTGLRSDLASLQPR